MLSYLLNAACLLSVCLQFLPQPLILNQQQLHLVGFLQASRWQASECAITGDVSWLTRLDIPKKETIISQNKVILNSVPLWLNKK